MLLLLNAWNPNLRTGPVPADGGGNRPPRDGRRRPRDTEFVRDLRHPQLDRDEPAQVVPDDDDWLVLL